MLEAYILVSVLGTRVTFQCYVLKVDIEIEDNALAFKPKSRISYDLAYNLGGGL